MVDDEELQRLDLSRFDAIVIGPGAYSARAELRAAPPGCWTTWTVAGR